MRGTVTINTLQLNRASLIDRRTQRLKGIKKLIELYKKCTDNEQKKTIKKAIHEEIDEDLEYVLVVKNYVNTEMQNLNESA